MLTNLLLSVGPVCAGINLEYYFSFVDPTGYGCGTKLPHNIVGLFGVMDGHASDLRTGLPWQMVEIHEPVRLLMIVEAEREAVVPLHGWFPSFVANALQLPIDRTADPGLALTTRTALARRPRRTPGQHPGERPGKHGADRACSRPLH